MQSKHVNDIADTYHRYCSRKQNDLDTTNRADECSQSKRCAGPPRCRRAKIGRVSYLQLPKIRDIDEHNVLIRTPSR